MDLDEQTGAGWALRSRWPELYGEAFQGFFHRLMQLRYPGFVNVRTAGRLGDQGSDGLLLDGRRCYACYGPRVGESARWDAKFRDDLASALRQRAGQFDTFVFVHNDMWGVHPLLSTAVAEARNVHTELVFEVMGFERILDELCELRRDQVERLVGQLPTAPVRVGLAHMTELLKALAAEEDPLPDPRGPLEAPTRDKLDFSRLKPRTRADLVTAMASTVLVDGYYRERIDVTERDRAGARFGKEYRRAVVEGKDPDEVLAHLRAFLVGTAMPDDATWRAANVVLAAFFETCDVFENPPPGWRAEHEVQS